jgi:hypothetical protein
MKRLSLIVSLLALSILSLQSQTLQIKPTEKNWLRPFAMLQFWGTYSTGQEVYDPATEQYKAVENRADVLIRRGRIGFKGTPYKRLSFSVVSSFDLIGRDLLAATNGGSNPATPALSIWDAFMQYRVLKGKESLYLTAGFFRPQLGRESITSGWSVNSLEKAMSQTYLRKHLVGTGPGRATGLNLGGLLRGESAFALSYNLGFFTPLFTDPALRGTSIGRRYAPLWVGRVVLHIGDPEQDRYKIGYKINYMSQRKGLSLAVGGSHQGETVLFKSSQTLGADLLFNYGPINLDADFAYLKRNGLRLLDGAGMRSFAYNSYTGHVRMGLNAIRKDWGVIEPVFMFMFFQGQTDLLSQEDAAAVGAFSGVEHTYDAGFNWYLDDRRLKLALHYTWRQGDPGDLGLGATPNDFFRQSGLGPIRRGNWLGVGLSTIF